jgi:hypothetical protein
MMKLKLIGIVLTVICGLVHLSAREPLRVGIEVPEPKLIHKVEMICPEAVKIAEVNGPVVAKILINEQGTVDEVRAILYQPAILEAAKLALKQWRFSPTFLNGKAVSITATVVVIFAVSSSPDSIDFFDSGVATQWGQGGHSLAPYTVAMMDQTGNLKVVVEDRSRFGNAQRKYFKIIPEAQVPFSVIEERMRLGRIDFASFKLLAPQYCFPDKNALIYVRPGVERLYYSVLLVSNGSQLIQLAGIDPHVQPPKLDIDLPRLAEKLKLYKRLSGGGAVFFYTIFVDEKGRILGIANRDGYRAILKDELSSARVIAPGMRNSLPVPTAVILAIPVQ